MLGATVGAEIRLGSEAWVSPGVCSEEGLGVDSRDGLAFGTRVVDVESPMFELVTLVLTSGTANAGVKLTWLVCSCGRDVDLLSAELIGTSAVLTMLLVTDAVAAVEDTTDAATLILMLAGRLVEGLDGVGGCDAVVACIATTSAVVIGDAFNLTVVPSCSLLDTFCFWMDGAGAGASASVFEPWDGG